jgi:AcrR family transcriptional regulator
MKQCEAVSNTPRWARRKEDRPQELLCAALKVFGEKGFAGARLEDVAKMAGVSKGTVYLYYSNKEELLKAVVREHVSPIVNEVRQRIGEQTNATYSELLRDSIHEWWDRYGSTQLCAITKLILTESHAFPDLSLFFYNEVVLPWWAYLEDLLKQGVQEGEFRDVDTEYTARVLHSPLVTLGVWRQTMDVSCQTDTDPKRFIDTYIQMVMEGLKNPNYAKNKSEITPALPSSVQTASGATHQGSSTNPAASNTQRAAQMASGIASSLASDAFGLFKIKPKQPG